MITCDYCVEQQYLFWIDFQKRHMRGYFQEKHKRKRIDLS